MLEETKRYFFQKRLRFFVKYGQPLKFNKKGLFRVTEALGTKPTPFNPAGSNICAILMAHLMSFLSKIIRLSPQELTSHDTG